MVAQRGFLCTADAGRTAGAGTDRNSAAPRSLRWPVVCGVLVTLALIGCSRAPQTPTDAAKQLMRQADFAGAARQWEQVLEDDPSRVEAWVGLGQCRFAQDDYRGAVDAYSSAIKIEPDNGQLFLYRSDAYDKLNDRAAAATDWKRGTELHPDGWARVSPEAGISDAPQRAAPDTHASTGSAGMTLPPAAPNLAGSQPGAANRSPGATQPGTQQPGAQPPFSAGPNVGRADGGRPAGPGSSGSRSGLSGSPAPSRLQSPLPRPAPTDAARDSVPGPWQPGLNREGPADQTAPGAVTRPNPLGALAAGENVIGPPSRGDQSLPDGLQVAPDEAEIRPNDDSQEPRPRSKPEPDPNPKSKPKPSDQRRRFVVPASPWGSPWQPPDQYGPWGIPMWNQTSEAPSTVPAPDFGRSNWGAGAGLTSPTGVTGSAYADTWNSPAGSHGFAGSGNATVVQTPRQAEGGLPSAAAAAGSPWRPPLVRPHSGVMLMDDARLNLDANLGVGPGSGIYQPRYNFNRPAWKEQPLPRPFGFDRSIVPAPR